MVKKWVVGIETLACIAVRLPQTAYVGLVLSLQAKWLYTCRFVPSAGQYLEPVELALCKKFIPALLQVSEPVGDVFCQLLSHWVKMGRIAIKNPVTFAPHLHQCSMDASNILVKVLHNGGGLNAKDHKAVVKAAGNAVCKARLKGEEENLEGLKSSGGRKMAKRLDQMGKTGAWLSVIPNCFDGTELLWEEFQDNLVICYGLRPRGVPEHCNGCREPFTVKHALSCKKGGFVG
jgi:hypothetical protein